MFRFVHVLAHCFLAGDHFSLPDNCLRTPNVGRLPFVAMGGLGSAIRILAESPSSFNTTNGAPVSVSAMIKSF